MLATPCSYGLMNTMPSIQWPGGGGRGCSVGYLDGPGVFRLYYVFIASWMAGDQVPKSPT